MPKSSKAQVFRFEVAHTWDGVPVAAADVVEFSVRLTDNVLSIEVSAPFYGDSPPLGPEGEMDGLWDYEVVELFLLGVDGQYVEVEMGPHGHYLVLLLSDVRQVKQKLKPTHFSSQVKGNTWQGKLQLPTDQLPLPFTHFNAYAIHGQGVGRHFLAAHPVPGEKPDFHQPRFFAPLR